MVYFNQDQGYLTYDLTQLDQWPFWLAEYDQIPGFYYHFDFWQYTHTGTVAGIQGEVDWNLDLRRLPCRRNRKNKFILGGGDNAAEK